MQIINVMYNRHVHALSNINNYVVYLNHQFSGHHIKIFITVSLQTLLGTLLERLFCSVTVRKTT